MEQRIEIRVIDGKHFACMEDLRNDALGEYNRDGISAEQARCALKVATWMSRLMDYHDRFHPVESIPKRHKKFDSLIKKSDGTDILWRAHNRGKQ